MSVYFLLRGAMLPQMLGYLQLPAHTGVTGCACPELAGTGAHWALALGTGPGRRGGIHSTDSGVPAPLLCSPEALC